MFYLYGRIEADMLHLVGEEDIPFAFYVISFVGRGKVFCGKQTKNVIVSLYRSILYLLTKIMLVNKINLARLKG